MVRRGGIRKRADLLVVGLCMGFLASGGVSAVLVGDAIRARAVVGDIAQLQVVVASVVAADAMAANDLAPSEGISFELAYQESSVDHNDLLLRLLPADRSLVQQWLGQTTSGVARLGGETNSGSYLEYVGLRTMLAGYATQAETTAENARQQGIASLAATGVVGVLMVLALVRYNRREKQLEGDLHSRVTIDSLTGVYSRQMLDSILRKVEDAMRQDGQAVAFMYIDADRFKDFNESVGYWVGDQMLAEIAARIKAAQRRSDCTIRMGGDEFVALLYPVEPGSDLAQLAYRYSEAFSESVEMGGRSERLMFSIGMSATSDPTRLRATLGEAEVALYQAKRSGGNQMVLFTPRLAEVVSVDRQIGRALDSMCLDDELSLHYQPIVNTETAAVAGFEALLRWVSPSMGAVSPGVFIPVAEQCGHISRIGEWVAGEVCRQIQQWKRDGLGDEFTVSFNVSPLQLCEDNFAAGLLAVFDRWPEVDRSRLVVEVTESSVLDEAGWAIHNLNELRDAGIRIAIDDFGSGYSNLGQLFLVPFDVLKLDRSLLPSCARGSSVVQAVMSMVEVFDSDVVFEGVETPAQLEFVRRLEVSLVQGRLTGGPMPAADVNGLLLAEPEIPLI